MYNIPITFFRFDTIESTNLWAKKHISSWSSYGITCVRANQQTSGRGQFGRRWFSPPDVNLYVSLCFWMNNPGVASSLDQTLLIREMTFSRMGELTIVLGEAIASVLQELGISSEWKYPNDLLVDKKKIGGILCETIDCGQKRGAICGFGLNVNMDHSGVDRIDQPASSLFLATREIYRLDDLLNQILAHYLVRLDKHFPIFSGE